ncbi:hypothetical protein PPBDW_I22045 [Photobacterium kishitanii]|nr:hypothetical protein PPBDW_I22045 [Photobacterium kishitanii]
MIFGFEMKTYDIDHDSAKSLHSIMFSLLKSKFLLMFCAAKVVLMSKLIKSSI